MAPSASQRVLVVDDEPLICESVKMMLILDGHLVETAGSASEALSLFTPGQFDLVITDFCMPGMKGDQFAEAIKERAPDIPVILLTAFPPALKPRAIDLVLTKPFFFDTLREALRRLIAKKRAA